MINNSRFINIIIITIISISIYLLIYLSVNHIKNKIITPTNINELLSNKEKAAIIKEIVNNALNEINNIQLINKSTNGINENNSKPLLEVRTTMNSNLSARISNIKPFNILITKSEREMMYKLLEIFDKTLTKHNIQYFMYGGTLLGSYRHHDLIPWDDDLDVIVPSKNRNDLINIFKELEPNYKLVKAGGHDKFFHISGNKYDKWIWKWPYVDISYYEIDGLYVKDCEKTYGLWYKYPTEIVFPLHRRPILNLSLPAPYDTFAFLTWTYNYDSPCIMNGYSHMVEGSGPAGNVKCDTLSNKFPFVEHLSVKNKSLLMVNGQIGVREVLKYRNLVINDLIVHEPSYAIAETFKLTLKSGYKMPYKLKPKNYHD